MRIRKRQRRKEEIEEEKIKHKKRKASRQCGLGESTMKVRLLK